MTMTILAGIVILMKVMITMMIGIAVIPTQMMIGMTTMKTMMTIRILNTKIPMMTTMITPIQSTRIRTMTTEALE